MKLSLTTALITAVILSFPLSSFAQEKKQSREEQIKELEEMLDRVQSAMGKIKPLIQPKVKLTQYDVRQLLYRPQDRLAPQLSIPDSSAGYRSAKGGGALSFDDESESETGFDEDQLMELIMAAVGEDNWEEPNSIEVRSGHLIIVQTDVGHSLVRQTIQKLRRSLLRSIQMEVGFYILPEKLKKSIEDIASKTRGVLGDKALKALDTALVKDEAKLIGNAMLTALSQQRVYLHQGIEQTYVSTFLQHSGGTGMAIATVVDPVIKVLRTGLALDLKGTLIVRGSSAAPTISMDVRLLQAIPTELKKRKTPWGHLDLPRVKTDTVRTSARVAPGAGMLVFSARTEKHPTGPQHDDVTIIVRPRLLAMK